MQMGGHGDYGFLFACFKTASRGRASAYVKREKARGNMRHDRRPKWKKKGKGAGEYGNFNSRLLNAIDWVHGIKHELPTSTRRETKTHNIPRRNFARH